MLVEYTSKYGKIVKRSPGLPEYWYKGRLVARGTVISSPDPESRPTKEDWAICVELRQRSANSRGAED